MKAAYGRKWKLNKTWNKNPVQRKRDFQEHEVLLQTFVINTPKNLTDIVPVNLRLIKGTMNCVPISKTGEVQNTISFTQLS